MSLLLSEVCGHVAGAFEGAYREHQGALVRARGGTLFVDATAGLAMPVQLALAAYAMSGVVRPVGGTSAQATPSDARLMIAVQNPRMLFRMFRQSLASHKTAG